MLKLNTEMIEPFVAPEDLKKAKALLILWFPEKEPEAT